VSEAAHIHDWLGVQEEPRLYVAIPLPERDRKLIACSVCGEGFLCAARTLRELRKNGRDPICKPCRSDPLPKLEDAGYVPDERHYRFWLATWTIEEIREVSEMIWGPSAGPGKLA